MSLGSCLAAAIFPFLTYNFVTVKGVPNGGFAFIFAFLMAILVICKHHTNLKRLANGKESKFSFKKKDKTEQETENETKVYKAKKKKKESKYKISKK